jgi:hypothetical protein
VAVEALGAEPCASHADVVVDGAVVVPKRGAVGVFGVAIDENAFVVDGDGDPNEKEEGAEVLAVGREAPKVGWETEKADGAGDETLLPNVKPPGDAPIETPVEAAGVDVLSNEKTVFWPHDTMINKRLFGTIGKVEEISKTLDSVRTTNPCTNRIYARSISFLLPGRDC